ncbi:unnamed protein product [Caenorhabditis bovis]|uniref:RWD domain-containing protein n=1 Tax=Caenorhabditis bovis TaxID=2654633 RepID=A0A8S1F742_9PELO|nr:unnamed protein product [Caenorhabditis bovis]
MDDTEQRLLEIESLASIFPDLLTSTSETQLIFDFDKDMKLTIVLPTDYPSKSPPSFELSGPYLKPQERHRLHDLLNNAYLENIGFPIIFNWITIIQDYLREEDFMKIKHGEVLSDRKSYFQAHLSEISCKEDVDRVMSILKSNSKIRRATHNILAYRYSKYTNGKEIKYHDCEDDGETGASSKMLELMERMKANNVMVVVTRWYGGIHLGPDRFRHINNLTRQILICSNIHVVIAFFMYLVIDLTICLISLLIDTFFTFVTKIFRLKIGEFEFQAITVHQFLATEAPGAEEAVFLFLIIPVFIYSTGIFVAMRMFTYATTRYRGFYDVDEGLREELNKRIAEQEEIIMLGS